ncbi:hypothetical protein ACJJTC_016513 [Scirpophaga incertulas]
MTLYGCSTFAALPGGVTRRAGRCVVVGRGVCCYILLSTAADSCDVGVTTVVVAVVATPTVYGDVWSGGGEFRGEHFWGVGGWGVGGRFREEHFGGGGVTRGRAVVLGRGSLDGEPRGLSQDTRHVGLLLFSEELGFREHPSLGGRRIRYAPSTGGSEGGGVGLSKLGGQGLSRESRVGGVTPRC